MIKERVRTAGVMSLRGWDTVTKGTGAGAAYSCKKGGQVGGSLGVGRTGTLS